MLCAPMYNWTTVQFHPVQHGLIHRFCVLQGVGQNVQRVSDGLADLQSTLVHQGIHMTLFLTRTPLETQVRSS